MEKPPIMPAMSAESAEPVFIRHGHVSVLAFGDDAAMLGDVARIGPLIDLPVEKIGDLSSGLDRMAGSDASVVPVLALGATPADIAASALAMLADHVRNHGLRAVAIVPVQLLDLALACTDDRHVLLLCAPSPVDIAATLALIASPAPPGVRDEKDRSLYPELRQLSEQVLEIARSLARLTGDAAGQAAGRPLLRSERPSEPNPLAGIDAAYVRAIIRGRRLRDNYFAADLFADPAWDMLLDLTAARLEQRDVAVSSLCIAAAVPPTTALRWIRTLIEAGLFVRMHDPDDGRRAFIALSNPAAEAMMAYLAAARRIASPVA